MVLALAVSGPPAAGAVTGQVGYFEFPLEGGPITFDEITGSAVNHGGAGGVAPGEVYLLGRPSLELTALGDVVRQVPFRRGAVDQATGEVYSSNGVYSASGVPLREFGRDAVVAGPDNSGADQQQLLRVIATGGTFTLRGPFFKADGAFGDFGVLTTHPLPFDASAAEVETALNELVGVSAGGGHVTVSGGPGGPTGATPYTITFDGAFSGNYIGPGNELGELSVDDSGLSGGFESAILTTVALGGAYEICVRPADTCNPRLAEGESPPAIPAASAPNAENLVAIGSRAVEELTKLGAFVRSFGWDVVASGPDDSAADERQQVTVNASGGRFSLQFKGADTGANGFGDLHASTTITDAGTRTGAFAVGQAITGAGIPAGTTIVGVAPGTLTISQPATVSASGRTLVGDDLPYGASAAQIESALDSLPTIGGAGGSVAVTGTGPYAVSFGGTLGGDDQPPLGISQAGLSGAASASVSTVANGGAFEVCNPSQGDVCQPGSSGPALGQIGRGSSVAEDSSGAIYVAEGEQGNRRVQKFVTSGLSVTPSLFGADEVQKVSVNATSGKFRLSLGANPTGTTGTGNVTEGSRTVTNVSTTSGAFQVGQPIRNEFGEQDFADGTTITAVGAKTLTLSAPALRTEKAQILISSLPYTTGDIAFDASPAAVEAALDALPSVGGRGGSVTVSGAPGEYTIEFGGGSLLKASVPPLIASQGTPALGGGSGEGAGRASVSLLVDGGPNGTIEAESPLEVGVDDADRVHVSVNAPFGDSTCPDTGLPSPAEVRVREFATDGTPIASSVVCAGIPTTKAGFVGGNPPTRLSVDPVDGEDYVAFRASNQRFLGDFGTFLVVFGDLGTAPELSVDPPTGTSPDGTTISGDLNPNGPALASSHPNPTTATYRVEYRKQGDPDWTVYAPPTSVGTGSDPVPFHVGVSGLTPKTTYELRVVAEKRGFASVVGPIQTITTLGAAPAIEALSSSDVTAGSAKLRALIDPLGTATSYHFEYGPTLNYGSVTPETVVGEGQGAVPVVAEIDGLEPVVYHFRVIASNSYGTVESADQTFNFYPEPCPNATVRQQTGSGALPDCRAYELVSPVDAGSATLVTGGPNSARASSPARLSFFGLFGAVPGAGNPPNVLGDEYVASRTPAGWTTHYVGLQADQRILVGAPPDSRPNDFSAGRRAGAGDGRILADLSLSRILDWDRGQQGRTCCGYLGSFAPYVWDSAGNSLGRYPTDLAEVPGGEADVSKGGFVGDLRPSPDFSHYFFSSANVAFAPGGLTAEGGSVYDNDTSSGSVTVVSKLQSGAPIPREPGDTADDFKLLPAASTDGSHILISATGTPACLGFGNEPACPINPPGHLYMRVDDAVTYDVSGGNLVTFEGMTADGSQVYFTSAQRLTADDQDSSTDLYRWSEDGDRIELVSVGAEAGDTDACSAAWIAKCGVEVVPSTGGGGTYADSSDNSLAARSGDVYFYSPEQFTDRGTPGGRNLYVLRGGEIRYVATLAAGLPLTRIQVSPDGEHAAFVTASPIGSYDNVSPTGICTPADPNTGALATGPRCQEMYSYDADSGVVKCVSCRTDGSPPSSDVEGSQDGIFMSDDGRTFFATDDPLVAADTNGLNDVYEYSSGRAQLISTGIAPTDSATIGRAGLVGVSGDGTDVYFATFEKLVAEDRNGQFLRFYDARVNGGFPVSGVEAECAAADECHGEGNPSSPPASLATSAALGAKGNLHARRKHRKHHRRRKHAKAKQGKRHGRRSHG